jgi:hypothetical protein
MFFRHLRAYKCGCGNRQLEYPKALGGWPIFDLQRQSRALQAKVGPLIGAFEFEPLGGPPRSARAIKSYNGMICCGVLPRDAREFQTWATRPTR